MRALSLTQPWAELVMIGEKRYETRSWTTTYRGPLAIHAAKGLSSIGGTVGLNQFAFREPFRTVLQEAGHTAELDQELPRGAVVAVCELVAVYPCDDAFRGEIEDGRTGAQFERYFGDFGFGRWAWRLENVRRLEVPFPVRGALGLWEVDLPVRSVAA